MPSRHSKANGHPGVFTYYERALTKGTYTDRLGSDSQLPFGYCSLSLKPILVDAMVSPSGRLYSKEAIYEYLLQKGRDLKALAVLFEEQEARKERTKEDDKKLEERRHAEAFVATQEGVQSVGAGASLGAKRERERESEHQASRKRVIDDTSTDDKLEQLKKMCPWLVQFTPSAKASEMKPPPKRPPSPFSGAPLKAKDLYTVDLRREENMEREDGGLEPTVHYLCPVSLKVITSQPVVYLRGTGAYMLQSVYSELALPTLTCPITSRPIKEEDTLLLQRAVSGFAETGDVTASTFKLTKI